MPIFCILFLHWAPNSQREEGAILLSENLTLPHFWKEEKENTTSCLGGFWGQEMARVTRNVKNKHDGE